VVQRRRVVRGAGLTQASDVIVAVEDQRGPLGLPGSKRSSALTSCARSATPSTNQPMRSACTASKAGT
jgi:hypothetical protein